MILTFPAVAKGVWLSYDQVPTAIRRRHQIANRCHVASRFQIECDGCGIVMPDDNMKGWASAEIVTSKTSLTNNPDRESDHKDFCPDCWKAMRVIARERSSKQA